MKKVAAVTLGCKVNQYDTEAMLNVFRQSGYETVDFEDAADVYIINTCTVTNIGDKKSRQMIRRARTRNSSAIIVAAGCYAQVAPDEVADIEGVNIVAGVRDRARLVGLVEDYVSCGDGGTRLYVRDGKDGEVYEKIEAAGGGDRTRAYIKVEDGCDQFCSYCIVPYARGAVRSRQLDDVLAEVRLLAGRGYKEIVIAGIHAASYGKDIGYSEGLTGLIEAVHNQCDQCDQCDNGSSGGIKRIRLSSIDPLIVDRYFVDTISRLPKLCDHFHLSLQSGCDNTLRAMNRRYTGAEYMYSANMLRAALPDVSLTTDVIVGFPGETEKDFNESLEFISRLKPAKIHVFPYSPKKGTAAAGLAEQIPAEIKRKRAEIMNSLGTRLTREFYDLFIGRTLDVLIETKVSERVYGGHTTNYMHVHHESAEDISGRIIPVTLL